MEIGMVSLWGKIGQSSPSKRMVIMVKILEFKIYIKMGVFYEQDEDWL
jgi:hypothetical protein